MQNFNRNPANLSRTFTWGGHQLIRNAAHYRAGQKAYKKETQQARPGFNGPNYLNFRHASNYSSVAANGRVNYDFVRGFLDAYYFDVVKSLVQQYPHRRENNRYPKILNEKTRLERNMKQLKNFFNGKLSPAERNALRPYDPWRASGSRQHYVNTLIAPSMRMVQQPMRRALNKPPPSPPQLRQPLPSPPQRRTNNNNNLKKVPLFLNWGGRSVNEHGAGYTFGRRKYENLAAKGTIKGGYHDFPNKRVPYDVARGFIDAHFEGILDGLLHVSPLRTKSRVHKIRYDTHRATLHRVVRDMEGLRNRRGLR